MMAWFVCVSSKSRELLTQLFRCRRGALHWRSGISVCDVTDRCKNEKKKEYELEPKSQAEQEYLQLRLAVSSCRVVSNYLSIARDKNSDPSVLVQAICRSKPPI